MRRRTALALDVLVNGTFTVLEAAVEAEVRKVVAASSASVYGLADRFPTAETHHPYNNRTLYGAAKAFNEGLLRSFHDMHGLDYVALRYFNVYGPRMDIHGAYTEVFIRWMERIAAGEPLDDLRRRRADDGLRLRGRRRARQHPGGHGAGHRRVFNVGTGTEVSLKEVAGLLSRVMGGTSAHRCMRRRARSIRCRAGWPTRGWPAQELGFQAAVSFEDGLRELVAWWASQSKPDAVTA